MGIGHAVRTGAGAIVAEACDDYYEWFFEYGADGSFVQWSSLGCRRLYVSAYGGLTGVP